VGTLRLSDRPRRVRSRDAHPIHNFGASVRYVDGSIHPFLAYVLPVHFGDPVTAHVVTAGVQGQF
jgi:hypothetical protein